MCKWSICPILGVMCCLFTVLSGVCAGDSFALDFDGVNDRVDIATALISDDITMSVWAKADSPWINDTRIPLSNSYWGAAAGRVGFHIMVQANGRAASRYQTQADGVGVWSVTGTTDILGDWHHLTYVKEGTKVSIVVDGKEEASRNDQPASVAGLTILNQIRIGCNTSNARFFPGLIDEVSIWNHARTLAEIQETMSHELRGTEEGLVGYWNLNEGQGTTVLDGAPVPHNGTINGAVWTTDVPPITSGPAPAFAYGPSPAGDATDVPREIVLGWKPGAYADTHDVYLGTVLANVDAASRIDPRGVLASQAQDANAYDATGALEFGTTYYWRVDEVNAPPSGTIIKGNVWRFTVEPYAYPIRNVTATAASFQAGMGPQNTVDGSGLNAADQHATEGTQMWLSSGAQPNWIQFDFDAPYKLHELWVWNSNQLIESFIGFGAKDVAIEYSLDGSAWTALADVPQFAKAPGLPTYARGTVVDLAGVFAKYVRLTIQSSWGGLPQAGLSEVRFFSAPVQAREPVPALAATGVALDPTLSWRTGREATSHTLFLAKDVDAVTNGVAPAESLADNRFSPGPLDFGTTYYWKVDEVGETATYAGNLWSFSTREYAVIEDMEGYNDDDNRIYDTWIDGWVNNTGSQVGYEVAPFAEKTIVHGGKLSMPLLYNNEDAPFYSEAEREFATTQNWIVNGADTLSLWIHGNPAAFMEDAGTITMSAGGVDIWGTADEFRGAFKSLSNNGSIVARIDSVGNSDPWAKAGLMIRDGLDPGAKNAMAYVTADGRVGWQFRAIPIGTSDSTRSEPAAVTLPHWLRLTRTGNTIKAEHSSDGTTWEPMTEVANPTEPTARDIAMNPTVYIGLAVTSHNASATTTATFSNISTTATGAWQVEEIGVAQPANDPAPLYVAVQDSAGKSATVTHPTAVTSAGWIQWRIPLSDLAGVNLSRVKKMTIGVGSRTSPVKGGAGILYIDDIAFGHPLP